MPQRRRLRPQRRRVFVGCEGESEANYCTFLHQVLDEHFRRDRFIDKEILGGGDPLTIVKRSITKVAERQRRFGRLWLRLVLLDSDRRDQDEERKRRLEDLANQHSLILIWQEPCFEAFLLRHCEGQEHVRPQHSRQAERALARAWPSYRKPATSVQLSQRFRAADLYRARAADPYLDLLLKKIGFPDDA